MFQSLMIQYKSLMIKSLMIQYNIIQDQTEEIFLYCIILAILLRHLLTRAATKAFKFHWFYMPFEHNGTGAQCESTVFAKRSIFHWFYKHV